MQRPSTEDLTGLEWRDTTWIERVGGFQNQQMVLDYFSMSPFWDRQCNNQILSMQTQYNDLRQPYEATVEALRKMTGIEFAVVHEQPPVWVIQKRYRRGPEPNDVNPIATYYIMGANVYQSPTIYSVIANRLLTSLFYVNSAFKETQKWMDFHPAKGYSWKSSKSSSSSTTTTTTTGSSSSTTMTATTTDKTKSSSSQQQQQQQVVVGGGGTLRARENQEFRHWMDRAIEASALRIAQNRFVPDQTVVANTPEVGSLTSVATSSQHTNREETTSGKRQRKKTDDGNINKRKKKATSTK